MALSQFTDLTQLFTAESYFFGLHVSHFEGWDCVLSAGPSHSPTASVPCPVVAVWREREHVVSGATSWLCQLAGFLP